MGSGVGDSLSGDEIIVQCGRFLTSKRARPDRRLHGALKNSFTAVKAQRAHPARGGRDSDSLTSKPYEQLRAQEGRYECGKHTKPARHPKSGRHRGFMVRLRKRAVVTVTKPFAGER